MSLRIKKNDKVEVIAGRSRGMVSRVLYVLPKKDRAVVENVNMVKRHMKRRSQQTPGGIVQKEGPIHISNLMLYCDKCKHGVRFNVQLVEGGNEKHRVCKECGASL